MVKPTHLVNQTAHHEKDTVSARAFGGTRRMKNNVTAKAFGGTQQTRNLRERYLPSAMYADPNSTPLILAPQPSNASVIEDQSIFKDVATDGLSPTSLKIENASAFDSTSQAAAESETVTEDSTFAPSVTTQLTGPLPARPNPPWPVTTPLRLERWRFHLDRCGIINDFLDLLHDIEFGFSYNSSIQTSETLVYPNMSSAHGREETISKLIEKEITAGRYKGLFTREEVEKLVGPFIAHPLGIAQKEPSSKPRLVENLSCPHSGDTKSLNALADVSDCELNWGGLLETISLLVNAPDGTQVASIDIEGAFRTIGIKPSEFWQGVVQAGNNLFAVDLATKFGGKRSGFNFERPAKAFCLIISKTYPKISLPRWVDDIMPIRYPSNSSPPYSHSIELSSIHDLGVDLGFGFAKEKSQDFGPTAKYIGFLWCFDTREVQIPEKKRLKYLNAVMLAQSTEKVSLETLRSLIGKLSHVAMIVLDGRVNMRGLWRMLANMETKKIHPKVSWKWLDAQLENLKWWEKKLDEPNIGLQLCTMEKPDDSFGLYCDASTSFGIGVVIEGKAEAFKFKPGWDSIDGVSRDIGYAEFVVLHFLIFLFFSSHKLRNHHLKAYSDNAGVVGAWKNRSSTNVAQNEVLGRILRILITRQCFLTLEYIRSEENPADAPSRGVFTDRAVKTIFRGFPKEYNEIVSRYIE
jgi:hypothetical protein